MELSSALRQDTRREQGKTALIQERKTRKIHHQLAHQTNLGNIIFLSNEVARGFSINTSPALFMTERKQRLKLINGQTEVNHKRLRWSNFRLAIFLIIPTCTGFNVNLLMTDFDSNTRITRLRYGPPCFRPGFKLRDYFQHTVPYYPIAALYTCLRSSPHAPIIYAQAISASVPYDCAADSVRRQ